MPKQLIESVAQTIKTIRNSKNMTQEELAEKAGLDRTYISGIERGVRNITLESLEQIVNALEITIISFLKDLQLTIGENNNTLDKGCA